VPLAEIAADLTRDEWYQIAEGKGVLLLARLRETLGDDKFLKLMDDFGRAHAGRPVSAGMFRERAEAIAGRDLGSFFSTWLTGKGLPADPGGGIWSIDAFEAEPERALIVYGTVKESDAQREAAEHLQRAIAARWSNVTVPIQADADVADGDLRSHHVLLVGRPDSNAIAARFAKAVPLAFGPASFVLRDETYAHPATAVIAAGANPLNRRYEVVLFAGLGAEATWRCVQQVGDRRTGPAEVWLWASGARPRSLVVTPAPPVRPRTEAAAR
jgi:hypothetical protein